MKTIMATDRILNDNGKKVSVELTLLKQDLERRRKSHTLSQAQVANAIGVSVQTYQRWVDNDFSTCNLDKFIAVLHYFESEGISTVP